jgi:hypothetical protein
MIYRFEPSLELVLMHDGNVFGQNSDLRLSDQLALLRPVLPLVGESERTVWNLSYSPEAEFYRTYSELNRLNHRAEMTLNRTISSRSEWALGGAYLDTADTYSDLLEEEIITTRTDRQLLLANTQYSVGVTRRLDLTFRYNFRELEYDDPEIIGHTSHVAGVTAGFATSPRTIVALDYDYQYFLYPDSGDYGAHNMLARFSARPTGQTTLDLSGGIFIQQSQGEDSGDGGPAVNEDTSGFIGGIEWGRQGRRFDFNAEVTRRVRASGGFDRSVLTNALRLSLSGGLTPKTTMVLSGLFQRNESTASSDEGRVDIMRSSLNVHYAAARRVGLRFYADYIYQQWDGGAGRDLDYPRVGLSVILSMARTGAEMSTRN